MDVGVGLPNAVLHAEAGEILEIARRAEAAGFSSLGTIDRLAYPNYEALTTLAACAAATERIRLATSILISPLRPNTLLLAKQAASVDALSGGRLVLGLAPGGRPDDYEASGLDFHTRGRTFDRQLEEMEKLWQGEERGHGYPVVPKSGRPTVILGGSVDAAFRRAARYGDGWMMGGGPPDVFKQALPKLESAWRDAGRDGEPRKMALAYFALGDDAELGQKNIHHYYTVLGPELADMIAGSVAMDAATVRGYVDAFTEAGCDELILFAAAPHADQVDLLRDALG